MNEKSQSIAPIEKYLCNRLFLVVVKKINFAA
jgi:hypothetical protein